jgi:hypothetical protein
MWRATFKLSSDEEVKTFQEFLKAYLRAPNKFSVSEKKVSIESLNEDECFVAAHWAKNRNPLGPRLYSVKGFDNEGRVIFDSGCPLCRKEKEAGGERTLHWQHKTYRKKAASKERSKILSVAKIGTGGRIRLSTNMMRKLKVRRGQAVAFILEGDRVVVQKEA